MNDDTAHPPMQWENVLKNGFKSVKSLFTGMIALAE